ncbi:hypothetical protein VTK56DRAFT_10154 [Thermocarpiscus australiensis]
MAQPETRAEALTAEPRVWSDSTAVPLCPPPPVPADDPKLRHIPSPESDITLSDVANQVDEDDIFKVSPLTALRHLSVGIEALVNMTGDIPPTPPPRSPTISHMKGMEAEKQSIVRSNSEKSLARLARRASMPGRSPLQNPHSVSQPTMAAAQAPAQPIDGVRLRDPSSPRRPPADAQSQRPLAPYIIVGENSQPLNLQHSAITRKFYCRTPPPISITDYLLRIHQYCPMSTGVYLATSLYIHRLAVQERTIVVTKRNAHRLLLAGLRVAMKALEDVSYHHRRISRVGGVSEKEMVHLEISFCFLTGFELAVNARVLTQHWNMLRSGIECWNVLDEVTLEHIEDMAVVHLEKPPSGRTVSVKPPLEARFAKR